MDQQREFGKIPNSFCVIGLTRNTPYVIHSLYVPEDLEKYRKK